MSATEWSADVNTDLAAELRRARAQIAALEQLLEVHEQTSVEQAKRLETLLVERSQALERERAARERLSASEQHLRLALDAGRMGTWEWDIVGNRVIWSAEEERLYGLEPGTFTGTIEDYSARIHPEDRETSLRLVQDALATRSPTHHVLHRIVRPDGAVRWLDSHARFLYSREGHPLRLVGVSTDVTEQRTLQRQLEFERARLNEVLMQAPAAITVSDGPEHVVIMQNEVARQLVGGRSLIGKRARDVFPEIEAQGFVKLQDDVYRTGVPFVGREMAVHFDRAGVGVPEETYFNFVYQPLRNVDGTVYGILTHAVEVTDQVRARQLVEDQVQKLARLSAELERSNRDLDQFAYVASHDLKAPLRGIANLTQWIEEDLGDRVTGESREHMRLLKGRVNRMEALIEGILLYSRAGRVRSKTEQVDVRALVADTLELLSPPQGTSVTVDGELPVIVTERVPLQQALMNLIGNAIKHSSRADAKVRITGTVLDEDFLRFSISDNGAGIAPQFQERIWQIFQTLAPRDEVEGTGIGLAVVKKLVESRGGQVSLESDVGRGSTFSFTWPRRPKGFE